MAKAAKKKKAKKKSTVTIEGKFTGPVNNHVVLDVFRPNSLPNPYDFHKSYNGNFKEVLKDLEPGLQYAIDFSGFTTTTFDLSISGDFTGTNPITDSYSNTAFNPGFAITTK